MIFDNHHLSFISSYSAYEIRLTIFVFQLSIYAFYILEDEILEDEILENEISSLRPGQHRSTVPFAEGPITEVIGLTRAQELDFISRVRGGTALESHTASLLREPDII